MKYTAKGTHNRHFELLNDKGEQVGKLDYTSWFSRREAAMHVGEKEYLIAPTGILQTSVVVTEGDTKLYTLNYNWKGHIIIEKENGPAYTFKRVGVFGGHMGLFTEHEREIVILKHHFELTKWSFSYEIETDDNYTEGKDAAMLLLQVYAANAMHMVFAGAV